MSESEKDALIRYAAGEITWSTLRERGIENYVDVLVVDWRPSSRPFGTTTPGHNWYWRRTR